MKLNQGFTLAEVLVTIAVIGVISSLALPMLMDAIPNREQVLLKKAYYIASRNINEMINDEELYPERAIENQSGFSNTSIRDLTADGREATFHGQQFSGPEKFCRLFAARMNIRGNVHCEAERSFEDGGNFQSADGIIWRMPVGENGTFGGANNGRQTIEIDVSDSTGRNCFANLANVNACPIPDRFRIFVDRFGIITVPENGIEQEYLTRSATNISYSDTLRAMRRRARRN